MKATEPGGGTYTLRRRWWPWRWKQRNIGDGTFFDTFPDFGGVDDIAGALLVLVLGLVAAILLPVILVLLITGIEWILLLMLMPIAVAGRVVLGKHWTIEVRHQDQLWEIDGGTWRESQATLQQIATQIESGNSPDLGAAVA
ncbi:hypothetical protein Back2_09080 [Nocardioides baekrokdamisoli]|uniref:Uncharacterized protein n=1 Tax=Nocardioides baekrokdamisoli TaxID=1804624 RepID=A0A3G9ISK5_9ACTN|nr:hypothetical protein [Nocardioides baekrokdamisoli]BBH16621.1 hypothetical protein Back2_09080 [Nocardioides baekrokdamisoli]